MRKTAVLFLVFIAFISAALIIQRKTDEDKNSFTAIKENMGRYEYDKGGLGIAVSRTMTSKAVVHNFGRPIYPADKKLQYVWVYIKVVNSGTTAVQLKPDEFTLSIPGKAAVNYDYKASNSMQKCLKPINLDPEKENIGVLIFPLPESNAYTLHYNGPNGKVEKRLVIDSP
ncbi:MAG: hypothetical protein APF77_04400 [Clostridia bacterium BRH_c25]|nr:MAG: hypothetical protein APF77_04400 [Clostridia bacterium BRH_c25]